MLERLGMDVDECIITYLIMFKRLFEKNKVFPTNPNGLLKTSFLSDFLEEPSISPT